jgi:hypothetical protein
MPGPVGEPFINRHWKWLVPVGCLGLLVMLGAFALGTLVVVFTAIKSSDVYREAIQIARAHPGVRSELGDPIETGWFVSGSVQVTGPSGHADISVPLSGSRRSGTLYGVADKSAGRWAFSLLEVEVEGRAGRLELRGKAP